MTIISGCRVKARDCYQRVYIARQAQIIVAIWLSGSWLQQNHYSDVIMDTMASQITSLAIVYLTVYSNNVTRSAVGLSQASSCWKQMGTHAPTENVENAYFFKNHPEHR